MNSGQELLAVDLGDSKTGVARMNTVAKIPEPLPLITVQGEDLLKTIQGLAEELTSEKILVGLPVGLSSGEDTAQTQKSRTFAEELAKHTGLPVELVDESLSSVLSDKWRTRYPDAAEDSLAACVILERYMEGQGTDK